MKRARSPVYFLAVLRTLLGYISYLMANLLFMILAAPLLILLSPWPRAKYRLTHFAVHRYLAFLTRLYLPALGIYRIVEVSGRERAMSEAPAVIVSNHRGFLDTPLLLGLLPSTGVLIKMRYARWPIHAQLIRHFDLICVDRNSTASLMQAVDGCRRLIEKGKNLLIYPEGSRAPTGRLKPFNTLAFRIAIETKKPVFPVIVHSTLPFMAKAPGSVFPPERFDYRIRFLDPETPRPDDTPETLCDRVYRSMARELKELDRGTFWEKDKGVHS